MRWIKISVILGCVVVILAGVVEEKRPVRRRSESDIWLDSAPSVSPSGFENTTSFSNEGLSTIENEGNNLIIIDLPTNTTLREQGKQVAPPANPVGNIASRLPCTCKEGICACCTGMLLQALRSKGCMNLKYVADDFAFIFEMKMNNQVLYKNKISGRNPAPICINPPRFPYIEVCATFYDVYFFGRNMHACMEFGGYFQGYELFSRSFDCLRMGAQGVKIVKPEDDVRPDKPESSAGNATQAIIDSGDGIEDYDENLIRRFEGSPVSTKYQKPIAAAPKKEKPVVAVAAAEDSDSEDEDDDDEEFSLL